MKTVKFRSSLALATLIIGGAIYGLSSLAYIAQFIASLQPQVGTLSQILAGYAVTIAGFLATIATFLFTLGNKPYFDFYKRRGNFGDLMFLHALAMLVLAAIFVLAVALLAKPELLRPTLVLVLLSLLQLLTLTVCSYSLSNRSNE